MASDFHTQQRKVSMGDINIIYQRRVFNGFGIFKEKTSFKEKGRCQKWFLFEKYLIGNKLSFVKRRKHREVGLFKMQITR